MSDDFERLLLARLPSLRRYALRLARDPDRAEDLLQDALVRCLERRHLFAAGTSLRAWTAAVMVHLWVDELRREVVRSRVYCHRGDASRVADEAAVDPMVLLVARDAARAVRRLPVAQGRALRGVASGCSCRDVAASEGVPLGTVLSRVHRARAALREAVGRP